jgi:hypothetical protein
LLLRLRLHHRRLRLRLHCDRWLQLLQPSFLQLLLQQLHCYYDGDDASGLYHLIHMDLTEKVMA